MGQGTDTVMAQSILRLEARANPYHTERIGSFRPETVIVAMPLMASRGHRFKSWPRATRGSWSEGR